MAGLRDMRLFVAAYETESFTAAALRESATQSGVSQHVKKIENELGVTLFSRLGGRIRPTPAGERFYHRCIDVLRAHAAATKSVEDYGKGFEGNIVIGLMPTMTRCLLAPVLAEFIEAHPNVVVRIVEGYSALLTQQVQAGELDFAIVPAFLGASGLKSRLFMQTDEVLISRAQPALHPPGPIRLADLKPLKVVVPSRLNTRRQRIETYFSSNGIAVDRFLELDSMLGTLDFVAQTDWVTIFPSLVTANADISRRYAVNPIISPEFGLDLALIEPARKPLSQPAALFAQLLSKSANDFRTVSRVGRKPKPL